MTGVPVGESSTDPVLFAETIRGRFAQLVADSRTESSQRRARLLAHPDLAQRLCEPPLRYARPEQWTGYVPPATWREQRNDSPQRAALLELGRLVVERETAQQEAL